MTYRMLPHGLAAISAALAFGAPAFAAEPAHVQTVRYSDLNLTSASGARELRVRLERAAGRVCADLVHGVHDLEAFSRYQACREAAVQAALRRVPAPSPGLRTAVR